MLLFIIFPHLLPRLIHLLGVESNMYGLFLLAIAFFMILSMTLTSIVSSQMRKINRLVQQVDILENDTGEFAVQENYNEKLRIILADSGLLENCNLSNGSK